MPRVIRRTIEPAKLFACQSVEKRCTRQKASLAMRVHQAHGEPHDAQEGEIPRQRQHRAQSRHAAIA